MRRYKKRIADDVLRRKLEAAGAVLVQGPKWCGKTTTAEQAARSILYMDDPESKTQNLRLAETNIKRLLEGPTPRLIDEWQYAPQLWDAIRFEVDHRGESGQFVLTGSAVPPSTDRIGHTGTGRFSWLTMRTMSLYESEESSGEVRLSALFDGAESIDGTNPLTLEQVAYLVCRGGWPATIDQREDIALTRATDYFDAVCASDISRSDGIARNEERTRRLMRSYARHQGSQATLSVIREDILAGDYGTFDADTLAAYLNALRMIFVIEDMPAWNPNLRSRTAVRTSDTRYFTDPSIAAAALGLGPEDLMDDLQALGLLFETLCVRDLRVYAEPIGGRVYHFRDKNGLECDAVVHLRNGAFGLIEIKIGGDRLIEEGAANLRKLADRIDTDRMKAPAFLMLLTATGRYAYRRDDGIFVVPIGCLRD